VKRWRIALAMAAWMAAGASLADSATDSIARYREMLAEGNPAELYEMQGEALWSTPAGPKNATLERCDLGLGPGMVKGAFAQLPRYFADTDRVQDVESRLLSCMSSLQGFDAGEIARTPFGRGKKAELVALATWVSGQSRGIMVDVQPRHAKERQALALGRQAFYFQAGTHDFSCAACHGEEGRRIRLQELPNITTQQGAAKGWTTWPAYRVSNGQMWTMQQRLNDCFRQQRLPEPVYGSELTVALSYFMASTASGATIATPGIKR
jgi:L-cysteine S-thiosulfotransferase